jgi:predicted NUDIX family NTP pyrophosphohydrolase
VPSRSAGLVVYRLVERRLERHPPGRGPGGARGRLEVLLVHPGGPYWAGRDEGWWSIPKGEVGEGEDELAAAEREFAEELGLPAPAGTRIALGEVVQAGGKHVRAWAVAGNLDVSAVHSGTFELEWPPRSGRIQTFPEVDRAGWFGLEEARVKLLGGQLPFLDRLEAAVA